MRILAAGLLALVASIGGHAAGTRAEGPASDTLVQDAGSRGPFTLAVLRQDGTVIPFAHFDGRWRNKWMKPTTTIEVPLQLDDVPDGWWPDRKPIMSWTAWPMRSSSRTITTSGPVLLAAHCQRTVGLRTNFVAGEPAPPPFVQPYPKAGLATDGPVLIEPIQMLDASSPEWRMAAETVLPEVNKIESRTLKDLSGTWVHPVKGQEREKVAFEPEVVLRSKANGFDVYYIEGVKRYPSPPQPAGRRRQPGVGVNEDGTLRLSPPAQQPPPPRGQKPATGGGCELLTYASGWLMKGPGAKPKTRLSVEITDCNREGLVYTLPLGFVRVAGKLAWILQVSGWGYERYEVVEIQDGRLKTLISTEGGFCR